MPHTEVKMLFTHFHKPLPAERWQACLGLLGEEVAQRAGKYLRWQDAHAFVGGRLLLRHAAREWPQPLPPLQETHFHRPYLPGLPDFNLSHSDATVALAWSTSGAVGLDVEQLRPMDIHEARQVFSEEEWGQIVAARHPLATFYHFWTLKEAVMKADGRGFHLSPRDIQLLPHAARVGEKHWFTRPLLLHSPWVAHIATECPLRRLDIESIDFHFPRHGMLTQRSP